MFDAREQMLLQAIKKERVVCLISNEITLPAFMTTPRQVICAHRAVCIRLRNVYAYSTVDILETL
jgi:hypothetical protein